MFERLKETEAIMNEHFFLKGQRILTPKGEGEVTDALGDKITVKLDSCGEDEFPSAEGEDHNSAG